VLGKRDGSALAGHLACGEVRPTLEIVLHELPRHLHKRHDPETGLALIDPAPPDSPFCTEWGTILKLGRSGNSNTGGFTHGAAVLRSQRRRSGGHEFQSVWAEPCSFGWNAGGFSSCDEFIEQRTVMYHCLAQFFGTRVSAFMA
jgi:hypothetical protein